MSISNFIPNVWSETLQHSMNENYVGVANCSREYEGEIRQKGNRVKILNVNNIVLDNYTANSNMSAPQMLDGTSQDLVISRAKCFNFQLDDVDRAQAIPTLMATAMKKAAKALAQEADSYIFSQYSSAGFTVTADGSDPDAVLDAFFAARTKLFEAGVASANDIVFEVSPLVAEKLLKSKINLSTDNAGVLETGCIGSIAGCKVYVSNNVVTSTASGTTHHYCFARTRSAIAFADQLSEIEAYRPELRFADAVKGLHLYGSKVVYPQEFGVVDVTFTA